MKARELPPCALYVACFEVELAEILRGAEMTGVDGERARHGHVAALHGPAAAEAERAGLVSRIVPLADLVNEAMKAAETIAEMSGPIAMMTKEAINCAYETTLTEGVRFERRVFHAMFATADQKEGMAAFVEKRKAKFEHR